jgi:hypothetical protein
MGGALREIYAKLDRRENGQLGVWRSHRKNELLRESKSDVSTILVSYIIMFAYIAISLGHVEHFSRIMIDSKITLN